MGAVLPSETAPKQVFLGLRLLLKSLAPALKLHVSIAQGNERREELQLQDLGLRLEEMTQLARGLRMEW